MTNSTNTTKDPSTQEGTPPSWLEAHQYIPAGDDLLVGLDPLGRIAITKVGGESSSVIFLTLSSAKELSNNILRLIKGSW